MKQHIRAFRTIAVGLAVLVGSAGPFADTPSASAGGLDKGMRAYDAGDFKAAAEQWRPLAEAGEAMAQFDLALLYDNPKSGLFNSAEAAKWYRRAAWQGFAAAQFNLAAAYRRGRGVAKDTAEALFWLLVASRAEDRGISARAAEAAGRFGSVLNEDERTRAARRAENWRARPEKQAASESGADAPPYMTLSEEDVMTIQRRLTDLGYAPGPIDGIAGRKTRQAIAAFFKDRDIAWRQGPLSSRLLDMLR